MSGPKLDGAGIAKMATLEEAQLQLTRIHAIVERMAIEVRAQKSTAQLRQQIQRAATPLVGLLKGQFGMISDLVSALILVLSRGGSDQTRLRSLREFVGQIRTALEIAVNKTKELHTSGGDAEKGAPKG
ncbi:MAG: hypothetical protein JNJ98_10995 [Gemmatimonadetes bacterium]|nr:hypothetical protein [Gemmatimonadota bacterium]